MKIGVVGLGYVGSTLAKAAQLAGHSVVGVEIDSKRIKELSSVGFPVSPDFNTLSGAEVVVIAVPTPLDSERKPDLTFLEEACRSLNPVVGADTLIVNESTSYPGTLRNFIKPRVGKAKYFAAAPERVDPGNKKYGIRNTPRLVAGLDIESSKRAVAFYKTICDEVVEVSSPEVAEAAKLFENTFRQVNIALVNEFAQVADKLGISTSETIEAASSKPFGFMPFMASVGVGGHCIPVDPSYLSYVAKELGVSTRFIDIANQVNLGMPKYLASRIDSLLGGVKGKRIQIAGLAYKADVADLRESPAIALVKELRGMGAEVTWHDEYVGEWNGEKSAPLKEVDLGVIAAAHSNVDYGVWKKLGVNVIDVSTGSNLGWPKFL